jgi:hypothetical protein
VIWRLPRGDILYDCGSGAAPAATYIRDACQSLRPGLVGCRLQRGWRLGRRRHWVDAVDNGGGGGCWKW